MAPASAAAGVARAFTGAHSSWWRAATRSISSKRMAAAFTIFLHGDTDSGGTTQIPLPHWTPGDAWRASHGAPRRHEGEHRPGRRPGGATATSATCALRRPRPACRSALRSAGGGGLGAIPLPEDDGRMVNGEGPAIRGAKEDDARLDDFSRPFMMLRHHAANGRSRSSPSGARRGGAGHYLGGACEGPGRRRLAAHRGGRASGSGDLHAGPVNRTYSLAAVEGDSFLVAGSPKALPRPGGEVVRLLLPAESLGIIPTTLPPRRPRDPVSASMWPKPPDFRWRLRRGCASPPTRSATIPAPPPWSGCAPPHHSSRNVNCMLRAEVPLRDWLSRPAVLPGAVRLLRAARRVEHIPLHPQPHGFPNRERLEERSAQRPQAAAPAGTGSAWVSPAHAPR